MFKDPVIVKLPELSEANDPDGPTGPCKPTEYTLTVFAAILF
jgi:hypothetical protein